MTEESIQLKEIAESLDKIAVALHNIEVLLNIWITRPPPSIGGWAGYQIVPSPNIFPSSPYGTDGV